MAAHAVDPSELVQLDDHDAFVRLASDRVGLETLGLRRYRPAPGEQLPLGYHYHNAQEEASYVLAGQLHVETAVEEFVVPAGRVFDVEPGNPHRAFNPGAATAPVELVAMGAPWVDDVRPLDG